MIYVSKKRRFVYIVNWTQGFKTIRAYYNTVFENSHSLKYILVDQLIISKSCKHLCVKNSIVFTASYKSSYQQQCGKYLNISVWQLMKY